MAPRDYEPDSKLFPEENPKPLQKELKPEFSPAAQKNENAPPKSLRLAFSEAADFNRVNAFFDPTVKAAVDPSHYITKRKDRDYRQSIDNGCVAFLCDENGDVQLMSIAYQVHMDDSHAPGAPHDYTEVATTMSRLRGYRNADLTIAALSLKEWWLSPPKNIIMASVERSNQIPQKICQTLGWEAVTDPQAIEELFYPVYKTVVDETGQNRDIPLPPDDYKAEVLFFACKDQAIIRQAAVVLEFMDAGGVFNKKTNHFIPVDFSVLEDIGLTRSVLETIAGGDLSCRPAAASPTVQPPKPKPPTP